LRLAQERRAEAEDITLVERQASTWKRRATFLGLALMVSVTLVIPFLEGHSLHSHFATAGTALVMTSMFLLASFMYAVGTAYNLRAYHRALRRIYDGQR
jgi:hypothetical protein